MTLEYRRAGPLALIALAHAPVNALNRALREALVEAFERVRTDDSVRAVVLHGTGKGFCAGGDRSEFGTPDAAARPTLSRDVLSQVESCGKPVVAAFHGFAVGGGLELALTCHARVAVGTTRIGLPEVSIGVLPLSGTQRLPRVLGIELAAQLILDATISAVSSLGDTPLIERFVETEQELLPAAMQLAERAIAQPPMLVREWPFPDADPRLALRRVFDRYAVATLTAPQRAALEALEAAVQAPDFQSGLERAQVLFDQLARTRDQRLRENTQ